MSIHDLPTGLTAQDRALQKLRESPLFPPEPPGTCYAVLEFPCVVENVADWEAAYDSALVQLKARLATEPNSLTMSLVSAERYYEMLAAEEGDDLPDES